MREEPSYKETKSKAVGRMADDAVVCAGQRINQEGSSPSGALMEGVISKGGRNNSPGPMNRTGQGVHREVKSEGLAEQYQAVIEGGSSDEPVGPRRGKVELALWRRRRSHSPVVPRCVRAAWYGRSVRDPRRTRWVSEWHQDKRPYKRRAKRGARLSE